MLTVPRQYFCCGSLFPDFGVRVSMSFPLLFVHINFSTVYVSERTLFGKEQLTGLTICSVFM